MILFYSIKIKQWITAYFLRLMFNGTN